MTVGLYIEAVRKRNEEEPGYLERLNEKSGGIMRRCPTCNSPMIVFATRWRMGCVECICPSHGLVIVDLKETSGE